MSIGAGNYDIILVYQFETQMSDVTNITAKMRLKFCIFNPYVYLPLLFLVLAPFASSHYIYTKIFSLCVDIIKLRGSVFRYVTLRYGVIFPRRFEVTCVHVRGNLDVPPKRREYLPGEAASRPTQSEYSIKAL